MLGGAKTAAHGKSCRSCERVPWRLGGQSEVREDLTHDDGVGELCDQATWAALVEGRSASRRRTRVTTGPP